MTDLITDSDLLKAALQLPNGARFYRCALQLNPFAYLARHGKATRFSNEDDYNSAMISACQELEIEVIGVTDHYRVHESAGLVNAARQAGIFAFYGFEAVTKDGVHFLCLFDPEMDGKLERFIGECGVHDQEIPSPLGTKDSLELLNCVKRWGGICIAAHVAADQGGLLKKLSGQTRANVWKSADLLACALAGIVEDAPQSLKNILRNKDSEHKRDRSIAIINAQDVNSPEDLWKKGSSSFIKMSELSVEGLRQAFLDCEPRVRLLTDDVPDPHTEIVAMTWEGGFLNGSIIHFNENLNVLVGGRGAGKSTVIESLRYILGKDPLGEDTKKAHSGVINQVLRAGTKISLLVRSHHPVRRHYTIERTVPNQPIVKDSAGSVLNLQPSDVIPNVDIFGQHEIAELTKSGEKLTRLLDRFVEKDPDISQRKSDLKFEMKRSQNEIIELVECLESVKERLAKLPSLEETLNRYQDAGLEERLNEKTLLIKENALLRRISDLTSPLRTIHSELKNSLPLDSTFLAPGLLEEFPNKNILDDFALVLNQASKELIELEKRFEEILNHSSNQLQNLKSRWQEYQSKVEREYEGILRELQKSRVDAAEFIHLRQQIEDLRPLQNQLDNLEKKLLELRAHRLSLLTQWEDIQAREFRMVEQAAKKVSRKLRDKVRVETVMSGNRDPLIQLLRQEVSGNLSSALERVRGLEQLSLRELAQSCRNGKDALMSQFGLTSSAADRISQIEPRVLMEIEELELPPTTKIELNVAGEGNTPVWQPLDELSTGQKATAILLLLLLESDAPLIIDQPEDDLDNRFITEGVVPILRDQKCLRQFLISTHNANIPVLGDAELILGLNAQGEGNRGQVAIPTEHRGAIDSKSVRSLVEEILEGGRTAFEIRRLKYGF